MDAGNFYFEDRCVPITENEATELLQVHNCMRNGYSGHDSYEEKQGIKTVKIVLYRISNKKWYVPKEK